MGGGGWVGAARHVAVGPQHDIHDEDDLGEIEHAVQELRLGEVAVRVEDVQNLAGAAVAVVHAAD